MTVFIGDIDERGYLNNLERNGIDGYKSLSELIANSIDACASNIIFYATSDTIEIHDDGNGMNQEGIKNMFSINRSNHKNNKTLGISGYGSKAALNNLASFDQPLRTTVIIYTYNADQKTLYKIEIPWNKIFALGRYTGQVICNPASQTEITEYVGIRNKLNLPIFGTQIIFEPSDYIIQCIEEQFIHFKSISPSSQLSVIFGKFNTNMKYMNGSETYYTLLKYNPLGYDDDKYYNSKSTYTILVYKTPQGHTKFISYINDIKYEFRKKGAGYEKKPAEIDNKILVSYQFIGTIYITIGLMKNEILNNPKYQKEIFQSTEKNKKNDFKDGINKEYEEMFFDISKNKDNLTQYLSHTRLIRNKQNICFITTDIKPSSARADYQTYIKIRHCTCELSYETISDQQNELDKIMGIQQNKNQHCGSVEKGLERWIDHYRKCKWEEIKEYFMNCLQTASDNIMEDPDKIIDDTDKLQQNTQHNEVIQAELKYDIPHEQEKIYNKNAIKVREYEYYKGPQQTHDLKDILQKTITYLDTCKDTVIDATLYNNANKLYYDITSVVQ
ncbi:ATP-binding protein [Flavobacterium sp.]|jgi:hypothetical protein|uniref:ATP-binding protein n=1 Tax=Flavobacterium sp. TaxID=239 RepID=UPI0037C18F65